jgi:hypothetical protein
LKIRGFENLNVLFIKLHASDDQILIVTFLTFSTTDLFNGHTIHFAVLDIVVEFLVHAVKAIVLKLHVCFTVTVDTPAHA